jgi:hypothetical protein
MHLHDLAEQLRAIADRIEQPHRPRVWLPGDLAQIRTDVDDRFGGALFQITAIHGRDITGFPWRALSKYSARPQTLKTPELLRRAQQPPGRPAPNLTTPTKDR